MRIGEDLLGFSGSTPSKQNPSHESQFANGTKERCYDHLLDPRLLVNMGVPRFLIFEIPLLVLCILLDSVLSDQGVDVTIMELFFKLLAELSLVLFCILLLVGFELDQFCKLKIELLLVFDFLGNFRQFGSLIAVETILICSGSDPSAKYIIICKCSNPVSDSIAQELAAIWQHLRECYL